MLNSTTGIFTEPSDFEAALRGIGCTSFIMTGRGPFQGRLTHIALHRLHLQTIEETPNCVASFTVPANMGLLAIPISPDFQQIWGGVPAASGEIMTVGGPQRTHARLPLCARWGTILLPNRVLENHAIALTGAAFTIPPGVVGWRPAVEAGRLLTRTHISAARVAHQRAEILTDSGSARGLEQEILDAMVACFSNGQLQVRSAVQIADSNVLVGLEDLIAAQPRRAWSVPALAEALGLSPRRMRTLCHEHFGVGPRAYIHVRRMQLVRQALRRADYDQAHVAHVAADYGFREAGRFAVAYKAHFGEAPSETLRRGDL